MRLKKDGTIDKRSLGAEKGSREGSTTNWLASFEAGERRYFELQGDLGATMRKAVPHKSRWPYSLRDRNFTTSAWTAVRGPGEARVLICVQRVADTRPQDLI